MGNLSFYYQEQNLANIASLIRKSLTQPPNKQIFSDIVSRVHFSLLALFISLSHSDFVLRVRLLRVTQKFIGSGSFPEKFEKIGNSECSRGL